MAELYLINANDPVDKVVDDVRRMLVLRALRKADGVMKQAAEIAGMKYTTFHALLHRLGIDISEVS